VIGDAIVSGTRQLTTSEAERGLLVPCGDRTRIVIPREHVAYVRLPRVRFGASGVLVLTGGSEPLELSPREATPQEDGRLLFEIPVQKGRRYTLVIRGNGPDQPVFVAADFAGSIDGARAKPEKAGPCDPGVKLLRPPDKQVGRPQAVALGGAEPCPNCGEGGHEGEGGD
jgi:hypothetical protein